MNLPPIPLRVKGALLAVELRARGGGGMHGHDPTVRKCEASLLWIAPGVRPGVRQGTQLVDIAPTVARWLGLSLEGADGRALD